jgi:uncharacterized protein (DUF433 family)
MPEIVHSEGVLGGDPRIEETRIGVYHVYQRYVEADDSPEEIATSLDISVAAVHAALAYAFSHAEEMRVIEARNRDQYESNSAQRLVPDDVR